MSRNFWGLAASSPIDKRAVLDYFEISALKFKPGGAPPGEEAAKGDQQWDIPIKI
jgi:hypothetical protein